MTDAILDIRRVGKFYGPHEVLKDVNFSLQRGSVACIIGPSGSGKSTLLRTINHLEVIDSGRIEVNGSIVGYRKTNDKLVEMSPREAARSRTGVGMVFQSFNLFPHMTALENVASGPMFVLGVSRAEAMAQAKVLLARVGLESRGPYYPAALSGGQQQRVAIARALALKPELMLFDEPTSALDPELVGEVLTVIRELADSGMSMVIVTHEIAFARDVADVIVMMDEGTILEAGPPAEVFGAPQHPRTQSFLAKVR